MTIFLQIPLGTSAAAQAAKVVLPAVLIFVILRLSRRRELSLADDVGIIPPPPLPAIAWVVASTAWMLLTNHLMNWRGAWDFAPWQAQPLWVSAARVLGVGVLGPIAEELLFRGVFYAQLRRRGLNVWLVISILGAFWAAIHFAYSVPVILVIFGFGLLLGAARQHTDSVITPILMHVVWNLYAVW